MSPRLLLVVTLVAGVLSSGGPVAAAPPAIRFGAPVIAMGGCACKEPTVAVDRKGRIFVTNAAGTMIGVSTDGGANFSLLDGPPVPINDANRGGDAIVQIDPRGRLVFSRLLVTGVQVAVSSTGARTWDSNVLISARGGPIQDRQWVAFGPKETIYVMWRPYPTFWTATSTDGGRTFEAPEPFLPGVDRPDIWYAGPPVVDTSGRVFVPLILGASPRQAANIDQVPVPQSVAVAVSQRGMAAGSFTVHRVMDGTADRFPIAAVDAAGRVAIVWRGDDAGVPLVRVAYSTDHGATWKQQRRPRVAAMDRGPWIALNGGRTDVLDFERNWLVLTRGRFDGSSQQTVVVPFTYSTDPNTDFAHFALLHDGRVVIVWSDGSAVYASVESKRR